MARYGGQFDPEIKKPGQFDAELNRGGQFDRDLIDTGTGASALDDEGQGWFTIGTRAAIAAALSLSLSAGALCANLQRQNDEVVSAAPQPQLEEEYWRNPTPPVPASLRWPQQWTFDSQEPAGSLRGVPEEEAGLVLPAWRQPSLDGFLYATSDDVVTSAAAGQPDEDFWSSGVAAVPSRLAWVQQWTFDQQEPAGSLRGVPEEDSWLPYRGSLLVPSPISAKTDTDEIVQALVNLPPDEDFWTSGVAPAQAVLLWPHPWAFDEQEPAGSLRGVPEEEPGPRLAFQGLPLVPVAPFTATDDIVPQAGGTAPPDEDFWAGGLLSPPAPTVDVLFFGGSDDVVTPPEDAAPPDEDYWRNGVAPIQASLLWPQPWTFDVQESAGSLRGTAEEDYWTSGVAPVLARLTWPQPWTFDVQEAVQAPIALPPDEDFWRSGVAPQVAALSWPQQWTFDQQEPGNLRGQPDEDFWRSGVAPVQATIAWTQPWSFETPERGTPPIPLPPDEDFWNSGVAPVKATLAWPQQWGFDVQEPGTLRGQPDEDFWKSGVAPIVASLRWPQPWSFEEPPLLLPRLWSPIGRLGKPFTATLTPDTVSATITPSIVVGILTPNTDSGT